MNSFGITGLKIDTNDPRVERPDCVIEVFKLENILFIPDVIYKIGEEKPCTFCGLRQNPETKAAELIFEVEKDKIWVAYSFQYFQRLVSRGEVVRVPKTYEAQSPELQEA